MTLHELDGIRPRLPEDGNFWIAPDANLIGNVEIGSGVSIWFGATLRGDNEPIVVGRGSNIQENCVLHTDMGFPLTIGADCTIGHKALLHGCAIGDRSLIGMNATLLNGALIGADSVVGACALVTEGKQFPERSLLFGSPARPVRQLAESELAQFREAACHYRQNIGRYSRGLKRIPE